MSTLRGLSNLLYRRPNLYLALLLIPPLTWFGAIYLGSLLNLLWQGFYTFDDFTMAVTPDLTLGNFAALFNPSNFDIILRTLGMAVAVSEAGQLQLNVMEPIIAYSLMESIEMLINGINTLGNKCIAGITANQDRCREMVLNSIGLVTALNPYLGYENSTRVAAEALKTGKGVYDIVLENKLIDQEKLDEILKPENMIRPRRIDKLK